MPDRYAEWFAPLDHTEVDHGRPAPWIEKGCDLPALHRWASCQLDRQAACQMIERALAQLDAAIEAARSARADREAVTASALAELREIGPPGTPARLTLGGKLYHVRLSGGALQLVNPNQPEDPCP